MVYEGRGHVLMEEAQRFATGRSSDSEHMHIAQHLAECVWCTISVETSPMQIDLFPDLDLTLEVDE